MNATVLSFSQLNSAQTQCEERLNWYQQMLLGHPLFKLAANQEIPRSILNHYAYLQYVDSMIWVPMLALMKEKVKTPRLKKALVDNLMCEAGVHGTSHVELARKFINSLQVTGPENAEPSVVESASHWTSFSEPQIAGWSYGAETLVPLMFAKMRPAFAAIPECDLTYLDEHISADSDEHSLWMKEAIQEVLQTYSAEEVIQGIDLGCREVFTVLDDIYAEIQWLKRSR